MTSRHIHSDADKPGVGARLAYHGALISFTTLAAGATLLGLYGSSANIVTRAVADLQHDPTSVGLQATLILVLLALAPLAAGAGAYFIGWQSLRLFQLARYLRGLHRHLTAALHRQAPLARLGFSPMGLPFTPEGQPSVGGELPLATLLAQASGVLLLGDEGIGKTIALRQYALALSKRRHLLAIAVGRAPLPVLVSLPAYAAAPDEPGRPRLRFLAAQVRAFGHRRLASRLLVALQRWHVTLLCDGLDEVPARDRQQVVAELAQLNTPPYARVRLVIACTLDAYLQEPVAFASLNSLARVVAVGLQEEQLAQVLRQASRVDRVRGESAHTVITKVSALGLGAQIGHPATITAFLLVRAAGSAVPPGRARLMHAYVDLLCRRAASHGSDSERIKLVLGRLASVLRRASLTVLPVNSEETAAQAVRYALLNMRPLMPCDGQAAPPLDDAAGSVSGDIGSATKAAMLEWQEDGLGLQFSHSALAAAFAALWLEHADDPTRPLSIGLLQPEWCEPVLLWSGRSAHPERLALRLLRMSELVEVASSSRRSAPLGSTDRHVAQPRVYAVALALAVALEGLAPPFIHGAETGALQRSRVDEVERFLRDIFEYVQLTFGPPERRSPLAEAIITIERSACFDLVAHLVTLIRADELGRLVRAQAIAMLGTIASPGALEALIGLLGVSDPVLRQAVDSAFGAVGPVAFGALQAALSSPDDGVRLRATEALSQGGAAAIKAALAGLSGPDARQRAASARALGTLKAQGAREPLLARLDDSDASVRIAAAWALGQVGTPRLLSAIESHLASPDPELRVSLTLAIGSIRNARSLTVLVNLLEDPNAQVRAAAAEALGKLGDERAVTPLRDRLADRDPWAQAAAATALRRLGGR